MNILLYVAVCVSEMCIYINRCKNARLKRVVEINYQQALNSTYIYKYDVLYAR